MVGSINSVFKILFQWGHQYSRSFIEVILSGLSQDIIHIFGSVEILPTTPRSCLIIDGGK